MSTLLEKLNKEELVNAIADAEDPEEIYDFIHSSIKNKTVIPEIILNEYLKNSRLFTLKQDDEDYNTQTINVWVKIWSIYAENLIEKNIEIPKIVLEAISKSIEYSGNIISFLIMKKKHVPDVILYSSSALYATRELLALKHKIPDFLFKTISKSPKNSYWFAIELMNHGKEIPDFLLTGLIKSKDPLDDALRSSLKNHLEQKGLKVPDTLKNALKKESVVVNEKLNKEDLLKAAANDPFESFALAKKYVEKYKEPPEELVRGLTQRKKEEWTGANYNHSVAYAMLAIDHDVKVPDYILESILESEYDAYDYLVKMIKDKRIIPDNFLNTYFEKYYNPPEALEQKPIFGEDYTYSKDVEMWSKYTEFLLHENLEIPENVIYAVSKSIYYSERTIEHLLYKKRDVPDILVKAVSLSPRYSYYCATHLIEYGKEVPEILNKSIAKDPAILDMYDEFLSERKEKKKINESVVINEKLDKNKLLEAVAKHLKQSIQSWDMHPEDVVELFDKIGEELLIYGKIYPYEVKSLFIKMGKKPPDLVFPYFYESTIINEKLDKEELMSAFLKNSDITYKYVRKNFLDKNEEPPEKFINAIAQSSYASENYFKDIVKRRMNVPDVIKKGILKDSQSTLKTWQEFGEFMPMNDIVNSISQSPYKSMEFYKIQKEKNKKVPPIILKSIISNEYASYDLAKIFLEENKPVPDVIIRGFISMPQSIFTFAMEVLKKGFDLPKIILRTIADNYDNYMGLSGYADFDTILFSHLKQNKKIPDILLGAFDKKEDYDIARFCMKLGTHHIKIPDRILDILIEKTPKHGVTRYLGVVSYDILSYYLIKSPESVANPEKVLKTLPTRLYQYAIGPDMAGIIHTKRLIKGFLTVFGKVPEDFKQTIINEYGKYGNTIPKEIADAVGINQPKTINEKLDKEELLDAVIKDANISYGLIVRSVRDKKEFPEVLYKGVALDPSFADWEAARLILNKKDVPDILIKSITSKAYTSLSFARRFWEISDKEPPEIILDGISKSSEFSLYYAKDMIRLNQNVPEVILKGISKNYFSSALYTDALKKAGREVPDIILKTNSEIARLQHQEYEKNKPEPIEEKLEKEELLDAVIKDKYQVNQLVFNFAANDKKIPEKLAEHISQNWNPSNLYQIATDIIKYSNYDVPEMILQGIAKSNSLANETALLYKNHYLEIPDVIMNALTPKQKEFYNSVWWSKQKPIEEKLDKNELLKTIIGDETTPDDSHIEFPIKLIKMGINLPDDIIDIITHSSEDAAMFVNRVIKHLRDSGINKLNKLETHNLQNFLKNIPDNILNKIAKNVHYSYDIGDDLLFQKIEIPDILLQKISKNKLYLNRLRNYYDLHYDKVPEIIANAVKANTKKPVNPDTITEKLDKSELLDVISDNLDKNDIINFAYGLLHTNAKLPDNIFKIIADRPKWAVDYFIDILAEKGIEENKEEESILLKSIATDTDSSYKLAREMISSNFYNDMDVPDIILNSVAKNGQYAWQLESLYNKRKKKVPDIIQKAYEAYIQQQLTSARNVAKKMLKETITEKLDKNELLKTISKNAEGSSITFRYLWQNDKKENIPKELLKGMAKDPIAAYTYATSYVNFKDVPQIILKGIAKDSGTSLRYAKDLVNRRIKIPNLISKSIYSNTLFAKRFDYFLFDIKQDERYKDYFDNLFDGVINEKLDKGELLGVIQKDYDGYIQIMDFFFRKKNEYPPEEFLKMATETDEASRIFAEYCLEMKKDIPDEVIKKVAENPRSAYTIAALMILEERKVPEILIKSIYTDPLSKKHFEQFAKNQDYRIYIPTLYYAKI